MAQPARPGAPAAGRDSRPALDLPLREGRRLALACDVRLASANARFGCSEVQRGFHHSDGGTVRLPLIVGLGNALKLQLMGEAIGAPEALRIGLVSEVVELKEGPRAFAEKREPVWKGRQRRLG